MSRDYNVDRSLKEEILDELCYIKNNALSVVENYRNPALFKLDAPLYHYSIKYTEGCLYLMSNFSTGFIQCSDDLFEMEDALVKLVDNEFNSVKELV